MMAAAKQGDTVKVHYTGTLEDGTVFDSSRERDPIQFTVGDGQIIAGFAEAIPGMEPGQSKKVSIPSDDAYGPYHEEMVQALDRSQIPDNIELEVGRQLMVQRPEGQPLVLTIVEVSVDSVVVDGNHPLAGRDLNFEIELVEIVA